MAKQKKNSIVKYLNIKTTGTIVLIKNLHFILFLGALAIIYIANAHYAESKIKEIQSLEDDIKKQRWKYMTLKAELMYNTKQIEIAKHAKEIGLIENNKQPKKLIIRE